MTRPGSGSATARASFSRRAAIFGVSAATVVALIVGAFHPEGRVWGFNHWAYWGRSMPWILAGVCAILFALAGRILGRDRGDAPVSSAGVRSWIEIVIFCALFGFVFLAARSHYYFLGDGYQTISLLATDPPAVKETAPLLRVVLPHLRPFFDEGQEGARRIYQLLSIASGVVFIFSTAVFARFFFSSRIDRWLFVTSCAAGGFALLFFGYVENYAPLATLTAMTFLTGIAIAEGKVRRVWILPPALLTMCVHVFGVLVLPAVAFVFLSAGPVRRWFLSHRPILWILLAVVVIGGLAAARMAFQDIRVQMALIPATSNWYASEGYTLFSGKHLLDLANLLFLLFPGLPLCIAFALLAPSSTPLRGGVIPFFLVFAGSLWIGTFLLNPGLGMPRDWDLFAFAGVPLVLFASLWILRNRSPERRLALACSIILGIAVLGPRVVEARNADAAIPHFRNYLTLDRLNGRAGYFHLVRHFRNVGRDDLAEDQLNQWEMAYPERGIMREADELYRGGRTREAMHLCRKVLAMNPTYNEAYMILGEASLLTKDYETARIASVRAFGLSADPLRCTYNAGLAFAGLNDFEEAEKWLRKAVAIAPDSFSVTLNYAVVCKKLGRMECYEEYLARAAESRGANPLLIEEAKKLDAPTN